MRKPKVDWKSRVAAWQASGKTAGEFGRERGWNVGSLQAWAWRLSATTERTSAAGSNRATSGEAEAVMPRMALVTATATSTPPRAMVVEVHGARLVVERGFDAELLREVVRALGGKR